MVDEIKEECEIQIDKAEKADKKTTRKSQNQKAMIVSNALGIIVALKTSEPYGVYVQIFAIVFLATLYVIVKSFLDYKEKDEE